VYEVYDGVRYRINVEPSFKPMGEYLEKQRRYTKIAADLAALQSYVDRQWHTLHGLEKAFPADL